jgi:hypothetical protein
MMTCCALGEQDAILGHVASRGDRFPRGLSKILAARHVNSWHRRRAALITNSSGLPWNNESLVPVLKMLSVSCAAVMPAPLDRHRQRQSSGGLSLRPLKLIAVRNDERLDIFVSPLKVSFL